MPRRPKTACQHPGCPELVEYGQKYCDKHRSLHPEPVRSASARGYGSKWQRESKMFLRARPLCAMCGRRATVVDHIVPHRGDQKLFWSRSNWQPLCKPCHDKKTGTEDRYVTYAYPGHGAGGRGV